MSEWLNKIYMGPINYGYRQFNYIVTNFIRIFFNSYSDKLFKLNDKIIEKNECTDEKNIFFLYPILFKESIIYFGLNTIKINLGEINGAIISMSTIGTYAPTNISIKYINLSVSLIPIIENLSTTSLLLSDTHLDANENNILDILQSIKSMLTQYFNSINCTIDCITIKIIDSVTIILNNIIINNNTYIIENIQIGDLLIIKNFMYSINSSILTIEQININFEHHDDIPEIYVENNSKSILNLTCTVMILIINNILIFNDINLIIKNNLIIIDKIKLINIDGMMSINDIPKITFDTEKNICSFTGYISLNIINRSQMFTFINMLIEMINMTINNCIIVSEIEQQLLCFENIDMMIVENQNIIQLNILKYINHELHMVKIKYDNAILTSDNINLTNLIFNNVKLHELDNIFDSYAKQIIYNSNNSIINISDAHIIDITPLIKYITYVVGNLFPTKNNNPQSHLMINIINTTILNKQNKIELKILIKKSCIDIVNSIITDTQIDILLNDYMIGNATSSYLSEEIYVVESIRIYLDPYIFDQLNYLFGSLSKNDEQCMTQTVIANSMDELESLISTHSLTSSINQLHHVIINDYKPDLKLNKICSFNIISTHIYLFNNLTKYNAKEISAKKSAFLSIILKDIFLKKSIDANLALTYNLKIISCVIVDMLCTDPKQKYLLKKAFNDTMPITRVLFITLDNDVAIKIATSSIAININDDTLFRILSFFSHLYKIPNTYQESYITFSKIDINQIDMIINYYPVILNQNILSIQDCKISLSHIMIQNIYGIENVYLHISNIWSKELKLSNMLQFVPNINIVQPLITPISHMYYLINKYFANPRNKKKLRDMINNLPMDTNIAKNLITNGIYQIYDFFL